MKLEIEYERTSEPSERSYRVLGTLRYPSGHIQCLCESRESWEEAEDAVKQRAKVAKRLFEDRAIPPKKEVEI